MGLIFSELRYLRKNKCYLRLFVKVVLRVHRLKQPHYQKGQDFLLLSITYVLPYACQEKANSLGSKLSSPFHL